MSIYVEILIRADMDELWRHTQTPDIHDRWDLRFTDIEYLPRSDDKEPQRFLYATRIGFGIRICGEGESVGNTEGSSGTRTSILKFWSNDPKSLIRTGSGYWKYVPTHEGIRFFTKYDYDTRFGALGIAFDSIVFKPLLGWATAWSFDCLRLWLEKGIPPEVARERSMIHALSRLVLAFIWIYQGLFPKLLYKSSGELEILRGSGWFTGAEFTVLNIVGWAEMIFGLLCLMLWHWRAIFVVNMLLLAVLTAGAIGSSTAIFVAPFNPVTLNVAMVGLSIIGLWSSRNLPTSRTCLRQRRSETGSAINDEL